MSQCIRSRPLGMESLLHRMVENGPYAYPFSFNELLCVCLSRPLIFHTHTHVHFFFPSTLLPYYILSKSECGIYTKGRSLQFEWFLKLELQLFDEAMDVFCAEPTLIKLDSEVIVFGDIRGRWGGGNCIVAWMKFERTQSQLPGPSSLAVAGWLAASQKAALPGRDRG